MSIYLTCQVIVLPNNEHYALRQQSKEQARAVLSYGLLLGRGNGVVVVPANENLSAVRFTRNNVTEYGWFGKKTADGREAYCIEPGVPLNTGNNAGYVISETNSDRAVKASLVDYYGHYKQPSLANKFYTESLINEVMNGYTTTIHSDINGQVICCICCSNGDCCRYFCLHEKTRYKQIKSN
ncbi:hypothetical protein UL360_002642 [Enterococcus faecium]|nr:hypothetical protein [Enterococcus faecium]EME3544741.1 hypothetical protein [Enterococcus faecium]